MKYILLFLLWSFMIYWIHRLIHRYYIPYVYEWHMDHHKQVNQNKIVGLHWTNLFFFTDTWKSTFDLWITEIIPTITFCYMFDCWWLLGLYWIWAAFFQENLEHNKNINWYPWLTSGKHHLVHHTSSRFNYGLFIPIWDIMFGTNHAVAKDKHS